MTVLDLSTPDKLLDEFINRVGVKRKNLKKAIRAIHAHYGIPGKYWPEWCFVPSGVWFELLHHWKDNIFDFYEADQNEYSEEGKKNLYWDLCHSAAALFSWQYTRGIYRFDEDLYRELDSSTKIDMTIPADVLLRMKEWCVYVEVPKSYPDSNKLNGFFAYIDWVENKPPKLQILLHGKFLVMTRYSLFLKNKPLVDTMEESYDIQAMFNEVKKDHEFIGWSIDDLRAGIHKMIAFIVNQLLYVCCDKPDISNRSEPGTSPGNPNPVRRHKGYGYFVRKKSKIWRVGEKASREIRDAKKSGYSNTRGHVSPHWRAGHYHGVWRKDEAGEPYFHLNWWKPIPIGVRKSDIEEE